MRRGLRVFLVSMCALFSTANAEPFWSEQEIKALESLSLNSLGSVSKAPSNRVADNPAAAKLGQQLFFDARLSGNGKVACASCHQPGKFFTDGKKYGEGVGQAHRNTPTLFGSAYQSWFYWDGRRDSLWSQALVPLEASHEMAGNRLAVVSLVTSNKVYRRQYEKLFGRLPINVLAKGFPKNAGPYGSPETKAAWFALDASDKSKINHVFANVGKAIASYERDLKPQKSRFDRYIEVLQSEKSSLANDGFSEEEKKGAKLFIDVSKTQCLQCHNGPLLSNGGFHNVGSGNFKGEKLDFGRELGLQMVLQDEFNCLGDYSDAKPADCSALRFLSKDSHVSLKGAFKTPSLRGLTKTAPYFHDGSKSTLEDVVQHYHQASMTSGQELKPMDLSAEERRSLVSFLRTL